MNLDDIYLLVWRDFGFYSGAAAAATRGRERRRSDRPTMENEGVST